MITITMHRDKEYRYTGFTISGHADYAEEGSDIVVCRRIGTVTDCFVGSHGVCFEGRTL